MSKKYFPLINHYQQSRGPRVARQARIASSTVRVAPGVLALSLALLPSSASALETVFVANGTYSVSADGGGTHQSATYNLDVDRPSASATVAAAWVVAPANPDFTYDPGENFLSVAGIGVGLDRTSTLTHPGFGTNATTRYGDVTTALRGHLEGLPVGVTSLVIDEGVAPVVRLNGVGLVVVWNDPTAEPGLVTVAVGAEVVSSGFSYSLPLEPVDTSVPGFAAELGVGISHSLGGSSERSTITVQGALLTDQAGDTDDGTRSVGGLITVGGNGDSADAEQYDVTSLLSDGDTSLDLSFVNTHGHNFDYVNVLWSTVTGADAVDSDSDGLPDQAETAIYGTDPNVEDSDSDGIDDGDEVTTTNTDPANPDSDGDGVNDGDEVNDLGTDPNDADTDDDLSNDFDDFCPLDPAIDSPYNYVEWATPTLSGNTATGTIGGVGITYTSDQPFDSTTNVFGHGQFPASFEIPNANPTLRNSFASTNTLEFDRPVTDPIFVFASIGRPNLTVPIQFDRPIDVEFSTGVSGITADRLVGNEGYAVVRIPGVHESITFEYENDEFYVNFMFGFGGGTGDADMDGTPDVCDICPDDPTDLCLNVMITSDGGGPTADITTSMGSTVVTTVMATDEDMDILTYSISGGADSMLFDIEPASGELMFTAQQPSGTYEVEVEAEDTGGASDSQLLTVMVPNNAPVIDSDGGGDTAMVDIAFGSTAVTDVDASDIDTDSLTYSISGGADSGLFSIDVMSGVLTFQAPGTTGSHEVEVTVADGNGGSDVQTVTVVVGPSNAAPVITSDGGGDAATVAVVTGDTAVTTVAASDADMDTVTFSVSGGIDSALFMIDASSGALTFSGPATGGSYDVEVTADDGNGGTDTQTLTVNVNAAPVITSDAGGDTANVLIQPNVTAVTTVMATDADMDMVSFSISGGADSLLFAIDSASGVLTLASASTPGTYVVEVTAEDGNGGTDVQTLTIDVNATPTITSDGAGDTALVVVSPGGSTATTVLATDADLDTPTYTVSGGADAASFVVDPNSGVLTYLGPDQVGATGDESFVAGDTFQVEVTADDGRGGTDTQVLTVRVNHPPEITSNGGGDVATVDVDPGETDVSIVTATDADMDGLTFSITGGVDALDFSLDSMSGALSFASPASPGSFEVEVTVTDGTDTDVQTLTIDVNAAPVITSDGGQDVAEVAVLPGDVAVTTVSATDAEMDDITFTVSGGADQAEFSVDPTSGDLVFNTPPAAGDYVVEVTATDASGGVDTQEITVVVNTPPEITSDGGGEEATVSLLPLVDAVTVVVATDEDGDTPMYSISGPDAALFTVDPSNGDVSFAMPSSAGSYELDLVAEDGNGGTDVQTLTVVVNTPPVIISNGGEDTGLIEMPNGQTTVTTVEATDADLDTPTFSISGGDDADLFEVDMLTGVLSFADPSEGGSYEVEVTVDDGNGGVDVQTLTVDVNFPPTIESNGGGDGASIVVPALATAVTTVQADDLDMDGLTYSIAGGPDAAAFTIEPSTGVLELVSPAVLDQTYVVDVMVDDGEGGTDVQTLTVLAGDPVDDDEDGIPNVIEETVTFTDPTDADSDDDGISDGDEVNATGPLDGQGATNPTLLDSDGDGLPDGVELGLTEGGPGTDPSVFTADADPSTTSDPSDGDSDDDGIADGDEDVDQDGQKDDGETDPSDEDSDGDGVQDGTELGLVDPHVDSDPATFVPDADPTTTTDPLDADEDDDGLTDGQEDLDLDGLVDDGESDPKNADSDGDSIQDGTEVGVAVAPQGTDPAVFLPDADPSTVTNPLNADTDNDGIIDGDEDLDLNGARDEGETDATESDSDGDGLQDGTELGITEPHADTDPLVFVPDADATTTSDPVDGDTDEDGLSDGFEDANRNGALDDGETKPADLDSDGDGLQDGTEIGLTEGGLDTDPEVFIADADPSTTTLPLDGDSDDDGLLDGEEDLDFDGLVDEGEPDPNAVDSDDDGLQDGTEHGVSEAGPDTDPGVFVADADPTTTTDAANPDSDGDLLPDGGPDGEDVNNNGQIDDQVLGGTGTDGSGETDPNNADTDDDQLSDGVERSTTMTNPLDADSDDGGVIDGVEVNIDMTDPTIREDDQLDSDGDGLSDVREMDVTGTDPMDADSDDDGLLDGEELSSDNPTEPMVWDTDEDGLPDGLEKGVSDAHPDTDPTLFIADLDPTTTSDPNDGDTDDDGLSDGEEDVVVNGLVDAGEASPMEFDTDGDGLSDGIELGVTEPDEGTDLAVFLADSDPSTTTDPSLADSDGDGVDDAGPDGEDLNANGRIDDLVLGGTGTVGSGETDPSEPDTDGDGLSDGAELDIGTSPVDTDTDDGGIPDGVEALTDGTNPLVESDDQLDTDGDGLTDWTELNTTLTDPTDGDSDDDGLSDGDEVVGGGVLSEPTDPNLADTDGDGLQDGTEAGLTEGSDDTDPGTFIPDADPTTTTSATNADSDGDGLLDGEEDTNLNGAVDHQLGDSETDGEGETDPNLADTDGDGLDDDEELELGSSPVDTDTDNGGITDGDEVELGTSPTDSADDLVGGYFGGGGCSTTQTVPSGVMIMMLGLLGLARRRDDAC